MDRWGDDKLILDPEVEDLVDHYRDALTPYDELPQIKLSRIELSQDPLFDDQLEFIRLTKKRARFGLCFAPGDGKTWTALERAKVLGAERVLIVTTHSAILDNIWDKEIKQVFGEHCVYYVGSAAKRKRLRKELKNHRFIVAVWENFHELNPNKYDFYIIDEIHLACNTDTIKYKNFVVLEEATWRPEVKGAIPTTGTPLGNMPVSIWPIVRFINPYVAGSKESFERRYQQARKIVTRPIPLRSRETGEYLLDPDGKRIYRKKKIPSHFVIDNVEELTEKLKSVMMVSDGEGDYENKTRRLFVDLTPDQQDLYDQAKQELLIDVGLRSFPLNQLPVRLLRLLQIAEGTFNLDFDWKESGKLDDIIARLKATDRKVIGWSRFIPGTYVLKNSLKGRAVIWNGEMTRNKKKLAKYSFAGCRDAKEEAEYWELAPKYNWRILPGEAQFFFATIDMRSSTGLNMACADWQFYLSFSFSQIAMIQSRRRMLRRDQQHEEVWTEYYLARRTWESRALRAILAGELGNIRVLHGEEKMSRSQAAKLLRILGNTW